MPDPVSLSSAPAAGRPAAGSPAAGSPAATLLSVRGLSCERLAPVSFDLASGECVAILGPSGAGKSVLLRQIADLDPGEGEVWLDGRARSAMRAPAWRRQVVYCQAEAGWWHEQVGAHFANRAAAASMLDRLGLDAAKLDAQVHECSTGERQRLGLARALLLEPAVLLLDEPTAALDAQSIARVEAVLHAELARGAGLVLVTHNDEQARRLALRCFHMEAGRLSVPADAHGARQTRAADPAAIPAASLAENPAATQGARHGRD